MTSDAKRAEKPKLKPAIITPVVRYLFQDTKVLYLCVKRQWYPVPTLENVRQHAVAEHALAKMHVTMAILETWAAPKKNKLKQSCATNKHVVS